MIVLDLDIGNTRLKWRLSGKGEVRSGFLVRIGLSDAEIVAQLLGAVGVVSVDLCRVASVSSDEFSGLLKFSLRSELGAEVKFAVVTEAAAGTSCGYDVARLGVDRWLAVLAASRRAGDVCLVVDCGSAITLDVVVAGEYVGGYIVPGLRLMVSSLFKDTHKVKVEFQADEDLFPGAETDSAVNRGVLVMVLGAVERVLRQVSGYAEAASGVDVVLTGGDGALVERFLVEDAGLPARVAFYPDLVLDGLSLAVLR